MKPADSSGKSFEEALAEAEKLADAHGKPCVVGRHRTTPRSRRFTYGVRFDLDMGARLLGDGSMWEPLEQVGAVSAHPSAFRLERRAVVVELLRRAGVRVLEPGAVASGITVSPNGLQIRVATVGGCSSARFAELQAELGRAAEALRVGGAPVLEHSNKIALTLGRPGVAKPVPVEEARCS